MLCTGELFGALILEWTLLLMKPQALNKCCFTDDTDLLWRGHWHPEERQSHQGAACLVLNSEPDRNIWSEISFLTGVNRQGIRLFLHLQL